jgi:hypothetical protein
MKLKVGPTKSALSARFQMVSRRILALGRKRLLVSGLIILIIIALIIFGIWTLNAKQNANKVNCTEISGKAQELIADNNNLQAVKKNYEATRDTASGCKDTVSKRPFADAEDKLSTLKFYRSIAISSYSFGDFEKSKDYADKALKLNGQVPDDKRGKDLPKEVDVKFEMEAIKNGNY